MPHSGSDDKPAPLPQDRFADGDHAKKSDAYLEEAKLTEKLADSCADPEIKDNLLSIAGLWKELARMRARLIGRNLK